MYFKAADATVNFTEPNFDYFGYICTSLVSIYTLSLRFIDQLIEYVTALVYQI